jgi:uncharacterized membrane protein
MGSVANGFYARTNVRAWAGPAFLPVRRGQAGTPVPLCGAILLNPARSSNRACECHMNLLAFRQQTRFPPRRLVIEEDAMAFCSKCGAQMADQSGSCPQCGQTQGKVSAGNPGSSNAQAGLSENAAGALSYALGWITGIIFFLVDKRPYVRFHAAQSIVLFGGAHIVFMALGMMFGIGWWMGGGMFWGTLGLTAMLIGLLKFALCVLWILLMVKAAQGSKFRVPFVADIADSLAGKQI